MSIRMRGLLYGQIAALVLFVVACNTGLPPSWVAVFALVIGVHFGKISSRMQRELDAQSKVGRE